MVKQTERNIARLAKKVLDAWDMDTLYLYAIERLVDHYKTDLVSFQRDWKEMFD